MIHFTAEYRSSDHDKTFHYSRVTGRNLNLTQCRNDKKPGFLIRSYGIPNGGQRCCVAQSVMSRFGPHWNNSKITWANIANEALDIQTNEATQFQKWLEHT